MAEYRIVIRVEGQDAGATSTLNGVRGALGNIAQFAGGGLIAGAISGAVSEIANVGRAALDTGISFNSLKEQAQIAFTTMLGDAPKAGSFIGDLAKFAAKTPFEFPDLLTAGKNLVSVGVSASRVIPIMTTLGDATAAMGTGAEGIKRATFALQQMGNLGRVSGQDMLQLTQAGIPAWKTLAASIGKTVGETQKLVSDGLVPAEAMFKALETGAGESLQRVRGMMAAQSVSFEGVFSTLKDNITQALGKLTLPIFNVLRNAMSQLNLLFDSPAIQKSIQTFADNFAKGLERVILFVTGTLVPALREIGTNIQSAFGPSLTDVANVVQGSLMPALQGVATWIRGSFVPALSELATWLNNNLIPAFLRFAIFLSGNVFPALLAFATTLGPIFAKVFDSIVSILRDQVGPALEKLGGVINTILVPAFSAFADWAGPKLAPVLTALANLLGVVLVGAFDLLAKGLQRVIDDFVRFINQLGAGVGKVKELFVSLLSGAQQFYSFIGDQRTAGIIGASINAINKEFVALGAGIDTAIAAQTRYSRVLKDDVVTATVRATTGIYSEVDALRHEQMDARKAMQESLGAGNAFKQMGEDGLGAATNLKKMNDMLAQAAGKVQDMVREALAPTAIEDRLKMTGNAWDEFRLRLDAINTGTPLGQYGDAFVAQVKKMQAVTGLALPDIASKFKDFSLFANMDWLKAALDTGAVDLGPIRDRIHQQIDEIIGFANLAKAAFDDVWASLTTEKKIDLASALGFDVNGSSVEGLKTNIQTAVQGAMTGAGDMGTQALTQNLQTAATNAATLGKNISDKVTSALPLLKQNIESIALPALDALASKLNGGVNAAVTTLASELKKALTSAEGLKLPLENAQSALGNLSDKIAEVSPTFTAFQKDVLSPLAETLAEILDTTLKLVSALEDLAAALKNVKPNPQFESHSPSPFETTLKNVLGYMTDISGISPRVLGGGSMLLAGMGPAQRWSVAGGGAGAGGSTAYDYRRTLTIQTVNVHANNANEFWRSMEEFEARVNAERRMNG